MVRVRNLVTPNVKNVFVRADCDIYVNTPRRKSKRKQEAINGNLGTMFIAQTHCVLTCEKMVRNDSDSISLESKAELDSPL